MTMLSQYIHVLEFLIANKFTAVTHTLNIVLSTFSNSGIDKVTMVKNALLLMSLCQIALCNSLLRVNEI